MVTNGVNFSSVSKMLHVDFLTGCVEVCHGIEIYQRKN